MSFQQKTSKKKWLIGGSLIFITLTFLSFYSLQNYSVYFYTPKEAKTKASELAKSEIRVGGMVKPGSVRWEPKKLLVNFTLSDLKETEFKVSYRGAPPDMFKEGSGVVVEGHINNQGSHFTARNLLVKHSEEYKIPGEADVSHKDLIQKSIIKNERS